MVLKYDFTFKDKLIRILQNSENNSLGLCTSMYNKDYSAYMCCHKVHNDMWCVRVLVLNLFDMGWLDDFIHKYELDIFMYDKVKGACTFFIADMKIFQPM